MSRALRRHHLSRLKSKRRYDYCFAGVPIGQHVATPARCSCWMCGNPRRPFNSFDKQQRRKMKKPSFRQPETMRPVSEYGFQAA